MSDNEKNTFEDAKKLVTETAETTQEFDTADIEKNKGLAALAYLIFFIPLIACGDSKFGRYHSNQGLLLLIAGLACNIVVKIVGTVFLTISWRLFFIETLLFGVLELLLLAFFIIGLVNAINGKAKELPIIGKFKIIK